ncbi:hypothetical protein C0J50_13071 [Silurus asotus]|uniref:Endonuclease/exonuclease/phosphatase domain-containing protein n=1 Tax=Silurus asotus TaxID=30991 RepID=A0AAD5B294_SILAS|nr:hypothetical protein C0J50_13071 [Silurus asotus]
MTGDQVETRNIGGGFKLLYHGVDGKRNGVGVILKKEYSKCVEEVKRVSDRVMNMKLEVEGLMINVISAYASQVSCEMEKKEKSWSELDEVVEGVPRNERLVIGPDFNGHGLAIRDGAVPKPGSDAASQDALNGPSVECGQDVGREVGEDQMEGCGDGIIRGPVWAICKLHRVQWG